ncbi:hypothetical protein BJ546DRAFT_1067580 [Cryomyces antarcticus]
MFMSPQKGRRYASDELHFTGVDMGRGSRELSSEDLAYFESYGPSEDYDEYNGRRHTGQVGSRESEMLIETALERIRRARLKGKTNVNLTQEELDALEQRNPPQPQNEAPVPKTPGKGKAGKSSRSSSVASDKSKKASKSRGLFGTSSPSTSRTRPKTSRKSSGEDTNQPHMSNYAPPGIHPRAAPSPSRLGTRSASGPDRLPTQNAPLYDRYYSPSPPDYRPPSAASNRSILDEHDWHPRSRSASNAQVIYDNPFAYQQVPMAMPMPPLPTDRHSYMQPQTRRRNVSGPPDVAYSNLRRVPVSSPLAASSHLPASNSDPALQMHRKGSGLSQELSSDDDDDDQGVQVNIVPDANSAAGYGISIERRPVGGRDGASGNASSSANDGSGSRRRKGKR